MDQGILALAGVNDACPLVALRAGVSVRLTGAGKAVFALRASELRLEGLSATITAAIAALETGTSECLVADKILASDGIPGLAHWYAVLRRMEGAAVVEYRVVANGSPLAILTPTAAGHAFIFDAPQGASLLSRFAHLRREGDTLLLDSPLSPARVEIQDPRAAALIWTICRPATTQQIAKDLRTDEGWVFALLRLFRGAKLLLDVDTRGNTLEDREPGSRSWEFADLVFHTRSRAMRSDFAIGGTYRFKAEFDPQPALKPAMSDLRIPLHHPDVDSLKREDLPFTQVVEERRSIRSHGSLPIRAPQLGEFLYRVARARSHAVDDAQRSPYPIRRRIHPSAGGCYPLELYCVVSRCEGLDAGVYHYAPDAHELEVLVYAPDEVERLLTMMSRAMEHHAIPQVLLIITARFRRMSWKYEGMAYAAIVKEVGVLYEAMYLVATAMQLAPCALGAGDAAHFSRIIGTDPLEEASVGEFLLGSRP